MARLTLERLGKKYGDFAALTEVSLEVADGEFVAILGASGCGKTTLLRQVAGFDRPDSGRILIGDTVVSTPERQIDMTSAAVKEFHAWTPAVMMASMSGNIRKLRYLSFRCSHRRSTGLSSGE